MNFSPKKLALVSVWDAIMRGARKYVEEQGFKNVAGAPILVSTSGACENLDSLITANCSIFGDKKVFLAQSDQLYLEGLTTHFGKVYTEIQSFRAEKNDARHLCQFSLLELEGQYNLDEMIKHVTGVVTYAAKQVAQDCPTELALFGKTPGDLLNIKFSRMTYREACQELNPIFPEITFGSDLKAEHEKWLTDKYGNLFLTKFAKAIKFWNMLVNDDDPEVVNSADLLLANGVGEACGMSEREHDYDRLVERLTTSPMFKNLVENYNLSIEQFSWYLDAHKDTVVPLHSGCGVGLNRVAQYLLGLDDIRDASFFAVNADSIF